MPAYEGPFELLLDLIEKRKVLVNEIALGQVTDEYIAHVRGQAIFPMEEAANFIAVAATLLLIKSKSLLPDLSLSEEEETDIKELEERLSQYEKVREAARELTKLFGTNVMVSRGERAPEVFFSPSRDLTLGAIEAALKTALAALDKTEQLPEVRVKPLISIEDMMDKLAKRVSQAMTLSFKEFAGGTKEKVEVIVSFLALLELVKQGAVEASQHASFEDIRITNTSTSLPRY